MQLKRGCPKSTVHLPKTHKMEVIFKKGTLLPGRQTGMTRILIDFRRANQRKSVFSALSAFYPF
jgi:hypothetical protein